MSGEATKTSGEAAKSPRDRSNKQHRYLVRTNKKMAEKALSKALSRLNILREDREIVLKPEQETAVSELHGRDVMAVLPTGFGKSMIFTVFALARQELSTTCTKTCVLVISPLKSIIDDQISEILSLNFTAMELSSDKVNLVRDNPPQFLYCSAEAALEKPFLTVLQEDSELHRAVSAIVVDESHTVEAWTG